MSSKPLWSSLCFSKRNNMSFFATCRCFHGLFCSNLFWGRVSHLTNNLERLQTSSNHSLIFLLSCYISLSALWTSWKVKSWGSKKKQLDHKKFQRTLFIISISCFMSNAPVALLLWSSSGAKTEPMGWLSWPRQEVVPLPDLPDEFQEEERLMSPKQRQALPPNHQAFWRILEWNGSFCLKVFGCICKCKSLLKWCKWYRFLPFLSYWVLYSWLWTLKIRYF